MRRIRVVVALACVLVLVGSFAKADQEYRTYLPIVGADKMGLWSIVEPEGTINWIQNPSAEISGNYGAVGGGAAFRNTLWSFYGTRGYHITTIANNEGVQFDLETLDNAIHYVTLRVTGTLPPAWDWSLDNATYTAPVLLLDYDGTWSLYGLQFPAAQANGATDLYLRQNGAGAGDFYLDAIQVEQKSYWTTYCDGEQPGCEWQAGTHSSASQRSSLSRAGGRVFSFTSLSFYESAFIGAGMSSMRLNVDSYVALPGGAMNSVKTAERSFSIRGVLQGMSLEDLHAKRQRLEDLLADATYPNTQPILLRYEGAETVKQIYAYYQSGMEGRIEARIACWEQKVVLRFLATDPMFYEIGEQSTALDSADSDTFYYTFGRLKSSGQWDDLGIVAAPTAGGTCYAVTRGPDGKIYFGGNFTGWGGVANRDNIVRYDPATGSFETVGGAAAINSIVYAMVWSPDRLLYVGGAFTNAGGDPNADYLAVYDPSADTFSAVAAGGVADVRALTIGADDYLYIAGTFANWDGIANADGVCYWDGAAYNAMGTGLGGVGGFGFSLSTNPLTGEIAVGGNFSTLDGAAEFDLGIWDGATWTGPITARTGSTINALEYGSDGTLYMCGGFVSYNGITLKKVGIYNGQTFLPMGSGTTSANDAYALTVAPNGLVYVSGAFDNMGGLVTRFPVWNGSSWGYTDLDHSTGTIRDMAFVNIDPVISSIYDIYVASAVAPAATIAYAGAVTVTNEGTENAYPTIMINRSGGTGATIQSIRNESLGVRLYVLYELRDGETLTLRLGPENLSVESDYSGLQFGAVLPNSDLTQFRLRPGENIITCYVNADGGATIDAWLFYTPTYGSMD